VVIEGHGEVDAVIALLARLGREFAWVVWRNNATHRQDQLVRIAQQVRARGDAGALLVMRDADKACPREMGPRMGAWLRELDLPFPVAVVLMKPEFEVLFLPCIHQMAGRPLGSGAAQRPGVRAGATWTGGWESRNDVKGWLTAHFPDGRSYKPSLDQLPLTRMIDLPTLRAAEVPCFGTLERAITFLSANHTTGGAVYPPALPSPAAPG
jgi:hypothetical protein